MFTAITIASDLFNKSRLSFLCAHPLVLGELLDIISFDGPIKNTFSLTNLALLSSLQLSCPTQTLTSRDNTVIPVYLAIVLEASMQTLNSAEIKARLPDGPSDPDGSY